MILGLFWYQFQARHEYGISFIFRGRIFNVDLQFWCRCLVWLYDPFCKRVVPCSGFWEPRKCDRCRKHRFRLQVNVLDCFDFRIESRGRCVFGEQRKLECNCCFATEMIGGHSHIWGRECKGGKNFCKLKAKRYARALLLKAYQVLRRLGPANEILGYIRRPQVAYLGFNLRSVGYFGWSFQEQTLRRERGGTRKDKSFHFLVGEENMIGVFRDEGWAHRKCFQHFETEEPVEFKWCVLGCLFNWDGIRSRNPREQGSWVIRVLNRA